MDVFDRQQAAFDKHRQVYGRTRSELTVAQLTTEGSSSVTRSWTISRREADLADIGGKRQRDLIAVADLIAFNRYDLLAKLYLVFERPKARDGDNVTEALARAHIEDVYCEYLAGLRAFDKDRAGHDRELLHWPTLAVVPVTEAIVGFHDEHLSGPHTCGRWMRSIEGADDVVFTNFLHGVPSLLVV